MIKVKYNGTLGNKLFQYAVARNLSAKYGLALDIDGISGFKNTFLKIEGKKYFFRSQKMSGHILDEIKHKHRILLDGLFQRIEYLPEKETLREWFFSETIPQRIDTNTLSVSIRRGWNNFPTEICPDAAFYIELFKKMSFEKYLIFTDSPHDPYFKPIINSGFEVSFARGGALEQFATLKESKYILMAPSTFTFWSSYLSKAEKIYWPKIKYLVFDSLELDWFDKSDKRNVYLS